MAVKPLPPRDRILQLVTYDPLSGLFTYKDCPTQSKRWRSKCAGNPALAYPHGGGYFWGYIDGQKVYAHRAAWKVMHGTDPLFIDHINGNRADNRIVNLRNVDRTGNARNCKRQRNNKSGMPGVHWYKPYGKWQVYISKNNKRVNLGYFWCIGEAMRIRKCAEKDLGYAGGHGRW